MWNTLLTMQNITFTTYKYNSLHENTPIGWPQTLHFAFLRPNTYLCPPSHLLSSSCFVVVLLLSCCCFVHACVPPFCWEVQHVCMNHDSWSHVVLLRKGGATHACLKQQQDNNKTTTKQEEERRRGGGQRYVFGRRKAKCSVWGHPKGVFSCRELYL